MKVDLIISFSLIDNLICLKKKPNHLISPRSSKSPRLTVVIVCMINIRSTVNIQIQMLLMISKIYEILVTFHNILSRTTDPYHEHIIFIIYLLLNTTQMYNIKYMMNSTKCRESLRYFLLKCRKNSIITEIICIKDI